MEFYDSWFGVAMETKASVDTKQFALHQVIATKKHVGKLSLDLPDDRAELVNSLIALLILPIEDYKSTGSKNNPIKLYDEVKYSDIESKFDFDLLLFDPMKGHSYEKRTTKRFFECLRNAIAHFNIRYDSNKSSYVELFNINRIDISPPRIPQFYEETARRNIATNRYSFNRHRNNKGKDIVSVSIETLVVRMTFRSMKELGLWFADEYIRVTENPKSEAAS